jgi:hypothetical protein
MMKLEEEDIWETLSSFDIMSHNACYWGMMEKGWEGVDWIHLAEKRDQWWPVNTVRTFRSLNS